MFPSQSAESENWSLLSVTLRLVMFTKHAGYFYIKEAWSRVSVLPRLLRFTRPVHHFLCLPGNLKEHQTNLSLAAKKPLLAFLQHTCDFLHNMGNSHDCGKYDLSLSPYDKAFSFLYPSILPYLDSYVKNKLVPVEGIEPPRCYPPHFECGASA